MEEQKRLNAAFSHDLKNPVTVLKGSVLLLQKGLDPARPNPKLQQDSLDLILQYTGRIEDYINAMSHTREMEDVYKRQAHIHVSSAGIFRSALCKKDLSSDSAVRKKGLGRLCLRIRSVLSFFCPYVGMAHKNNGTPSGACLLYTSMPYLFPMYQISAVKYRQPREIYKGGGHHIVVFSNAANGRIRIKAG